MTTKSAGAPVVESVRYLNRIHDDVYSLLTTLDEKLDALGWEPIEKNRVSYELGNGLDAHAWLLSSLWRFYVPRHEQSSTRLIAFELRLDPGPSMDEPILLVLVARAKASRSLRDVWASWADADKLLEFASGQTGPVAVPPEILQAEKLAPSAEQGVALCVPLFDLNGTDALEKRVVQPALKIVNGL
jgi:hypothetical protein